MTNDNYKQSKRIVDANGIGYDMHNFDERISVERAEEFADLCKRAFSEHLERNVRMGPCFMTKEKWIEHSKGCIGQFIEDNGNIIAFWLTHLKYDRKEAYGKILAIDPAYKGKHLGLTLALERKAYLKELGMNVYLTDTSLKAPHVVKFHKSYGCKAVGMASWPNTNYYTVLLRLALRPEYEISDFKANFKFLLSKIKCRMLLNEDGSRTSISKLYIRIRELVSI